MVTHTPLYFSSYIPQLLIFNACYLSSICFFSSLAFLGKIFCCKGILRPWAEGRLNCPSLELPERFKTSCEAAAQHKIFAVKKTNVS